MSKIIFRGSFSHYQPIDFEPYYVFTTDKKFLIKCRDYPDLISELSPYDSVDIEAEVKEENSFGTELKNVRFGGTNE